MKEIPNISFSKADKVDIEFEIFTLNRLFSRNDSLDPPLNHPHRPDFYLILYITQGSGTHHIDFRPYRFSENSILFISKGQVHAFEVAPDRDGYLILFTEAFLTKNLVHADILSISRLYNYHLYPPVIDPDDATEQNFGHIIHEMHAEYNSFEIFAKEELLRLTLKQLLLKAHRKRHASIPEEKNSEWMLKFGAFRNLLERHITETRNANDFADKMGVSYKHLNEICKSISGKTAKKFIDNYLVLEIKRQLATSDISVKELTYKSGFDEPTNFVKFFKKHTHYSPSQFKKILTK